MLEDEMTFGARLKAYRTRNGLTQSQLAKLLGVKQADISRIENGQKEASPKLKAAFSEIFKEPPKEGAAPPSTGAAVEVLLAEMTAARQEMGRPMKPEEAETLARASPGELLSQSALLREALEVRASRELLAGANECRKKREAARRGGGREC